jgi:hypothetical protein
VFNPTYSTCASLLPFFPRTYISAFFVLFETSLFFFLTSHATPLPWQGGVSYHLLHLRLAAPWETAGVAWIVPVMTFTVLTGLNTDYDVFLVSGVRKMRVAGECLSHPTGLPAHNCHACPCGPG